MTNKKQPAEICERLKIIRNEMFFNHAEDYIAFDVAVEIVRNHDVVRCKDCKNKRDKYKCPLFLWAANGDENYCGLGERKDGNNG